MARDEKINKIFKQFQRAHRRLKEALAIREETDITRDAIIQRFEFTFELLWKTLKRIGERERLECFSPKTAFRAALQLGLIEDEALFVTIIDARNKMAHTYSEEESKKVYEMIRSDISEAFNALEKKMEGFIN